MYKTPCVLHSYDIAYVSYNRCIKPAQVKKEICQEEN